MSDLVKKNELSDNIAAIGGILYIAVSMMLALFYMGFSDHGHRNNVHLTLQNYLLFAALTGAICALAMSKLKKIPLVVPAGILAGICSAGASVAYLYFREKVHTVELFLPVLIGTFPPGMLFGLFDEMFYGKKEAEEAENL